MSKIERPSIGQKRGVRTPVIKEPELRVYLQRQLAKLRIILIECDAVAKDENQILLQFANRLVHLQTFFFDRLKVHWIRNSFIVGSSDGRVRIGNGLGEYIFLVEVTLELARVEKGRCMRAG